MIDVARHFLPLSHIRRALDAMEAAKATTLHLHLTDSQVRVISVHKQFYLEEKVHYLKLLVAALIIRHIFSHFPFC